MEMSIDEIPIYPLSTVEKSCCTIAILIFVGMIAGAIYFGITMDQANLIEKMNNYALNRKEQNWS